MSVDSCRMNQALKRLAAWWSFKRLVVLLVLLNMVDAGSTHLLLHLSGDLGVELNPLMRWAYIWDPAVFWLVKMALVSSGLTVIAKFATEKAARAVVAGANALYLLTLCAHMLTWLGAGTDLL